MNEPKVELMPDLAAYRVTMPDNSVYIISFNLWCNTLSQAHMVIDGVQP